MSVPNYLKEIAYYEKRNGTFTEFHLKCTCGCTLFDLYENYLDKKEKEICKPYYDALDYSVTGGCFSSCTKDDEGMIHHWIHFTHDRNGPKKEVFIPPKPVFADIISIKAECSECKSEYVIFDNRYHGYSAKYCRNLNDEAVRYIPHYRKKKRRDDMPIRIQIIVENAMDSCKDDAHGESNDENCADAFTWFTVYSIEENEKRRKLFDLETD